MHTNLRTIDEHGHVQDVPQPHGLEGNLNSLRRAAAYVRMAALNTQVRALALAITRDVAGHDFDGERAALHAWVRDHITHRRDPRGLGEKIQHPLYTLRKDVRTGDCLDKSAVLAALLAALGHVPAFAVLMEREHAGGGFDHVYVSDDGVALDADVESAPPGWEGQGITRKLFPIFTPAQADELAGIGKFFKKLGKGVLKVAPIALAAVPIPGLGAAGSALSKVTSAGFNAAAQAGAGALSQVGGGGKKGGQQPVSVIGTRADPRFVLDTTTGTVYDARTGAPFPNEAAAFAAGVARDWSNVTPQTGPPANARGAGAAGVGAPTGGIGIGGLAIAGVLAFALLRGR